MISSVCFLPNTPTLIGDLGVKNDKTVLALRSLGDEIRDTTDAVISVVSNGIHLTVSDRGVKKEDRNKKPFEN